MKIGKKLLTGLIIISLLVTGMPMDALQANDVTDEVVVTELVCDSMEIIEHTGGSYQGDNYYYWIQPTFTVTFSDGTVYKEQYSGVQHKGQYYYLTVLHGQTTSNEWGVGTYTAEGRIGNVSCEFAVNIVETPIESITVHDVELIEGVDGYQTGDYFQYSVYPRFDVTFKNGSVSRNQSGGIQYQGQWYYPDIKTDQSYSNQWGIGTHKATFSLMGYTTEFNANVISSPFQSVVCDDIEIYEETNGSYGYDNNGNFVFNYRLSPHIEVTLEDGSVITGNGSVEYKDNYYSLYTLTDLSSEITGPGEYTATAEILGVETTYQITVLETPIESITVANKKIAEGAGCYRKTEYNPNTGNYEEYNHYELGTEVTIHFKDDKVTIGEGGTSYSYKNSWCELGYHSDQGPGNEWGVGTHTAKVRAMGVEASYEVEIVNSPYASLEILSVAPVVKGENCYWYGEYNIYHIPNFSYRVTLKDGTSFVGYYSYLGSIPNRERDSYLKVSSDQEQNPWTEDGNNYFTVNYAGLEAKATVDFQVPEIAEYYEEDGEIIYLGCNDEVEILKIPSEIDGMPVVAVLGLGNAADTVKEVVIPDSVEMIAESAFGSYQSQIEKITIGSGVTNLDVNMFSGCGSLREIVVSDDNASYCSIDGVVYDKEKTTVVVYPYGKGNQYEVPATVTNVDVMLSHYPYVELIFSEGCNAFIEEDGVVYSADKTKVISCNQSKSGEYIMPDTVTEIFANAFEECTELTSVTLSSNVTTISYGAFANCSSLTNVDLPVGLKTIERGAFVSCGSLETLELPNTLSVIGKWAFAGSGVKRISIPDSVIELREGAFQGSNLSEVSIGSGLKTISKRAFCGTALTSVTIGSNVETIGQYAFVDTPLESVVFNEKLKVIEDYAFCELPLKEIILPESLETIKSLAFYNCQEFKELIIPDSVTKMEEYVFGECNSLEEVTVGAGLSVIPKCAFCECQSLKKVFFKNEAVQIEEDAFLGCPLTEINLEHLKGSIGTHSFHGSHLTSVTLSEGVTEVMYSAFENSTSLATIDVPTSLVHMGERAFHGTAWYENQVDGPVYLEHILYAYKGTMPKNTELVVKDGTTVLTDRIFENNTNLSKITLPEGLLTIGDYAFYGTKLKEIDIPASVQYIGECALAASDITTLHVDPNNANYSFVDGALYNKDGSELLYCTKQSDGKFTVPKTVEYVAPNAFSGSGVTELIVKNYYTEFAEGAFGYEKIPNGLNKGQYLDVKMVCYENSLADVYARKNLMSVEIVELDADDIKVETLPTKVEYERGEPLDTTGLCLAVTYCDGSTEVVSEGFEVSEFNSSTVGTKVVTVNYRGATTEFTVYVKEPTVTGIEVKDMPTKQEYERGEELNTAGMSVLVRYSDGSTESITEGFTVDAFDSSIVGTKTVTVSYEGFTAEFTVYVKKPTVTGIEVKDMPTKHEYERGEKLNTTGMSVLVRYSDGSTESIAEGFTVGAFDSSVVGTKTVTVSYEGFTAEFTVYVKEPTVKSIAVDTKPTKTVYNMGDTIDTEGLKLLATYSDGSTQKVTSGYEINEYELNSAGKQEIMVWYDGVSTSFDIVVRQEGKAIIGSASGKAGETVEITVSFDKSTNVKSLGIFDLVYDESKLELVSGTWDTEGFLSDWNEEKEQGVLAFAENTEVKQFFAFTFKILEDTEDGDIPIMCRIVGKEKTENEGEIDINIICEVGNVTVYSVLPGDVDGNEILNADDAIYLLYHTMNAAEYPINQNCDFNKDGMLNSDDSIYLLYHIMLPETYPLAL